MIRYNDITSWLKLRLGAFALMLVLCACGGESEFVAPPEPNNAFEIATTTPDGPATYQGTTSYSEFNGGHILQGVSQEASGDGVVLTIIVPGELRSGTYDVDRGEAEVQLRVTNEGATYESVSAGGFITLSLDEGIISGGFTLLFENALGEDASAEGRLRVQEGFTKN